MMVTGIRRQAYSGAGAYQITAGGTLAYAPGVNGDVGQLVRLGRDGRTAPLKVPAAAHLRFTPSPDGHRIASVVEGVERQELHLYDLVTGASETIDQGLFLGPRRGVPMAAAWRIESS